MATKEVFTETGSSVQQLPPEAPLEKLQIRNVLCPLDFSEFSRLAFHYAASIARHFRSQFFVQHTVQIPTWTFLEGAGPSAPQNAFQAELRQAEKEIRLLSSHAGLEPSEVLVLIHEGDARDRILQTIQEQRIDLLVMGTHGRKGFRRLALGSVTEHIIHAAVCPVLVVSRPQGDFVSPQTWQPIALKTILLATDFSRASDRALAYALKWAAEWSGKIILFHAVGGIPAAMAERADLLREYSPRFEEQIAEAWEKQIAEAWEKIQLLIPPAIQNSCEVSYEIRRGDPREQILQVAEDKHADLIVMGARGLGGLSLAWGSTSSAVVRDGRRPVLVVRHLPGSPSNGSGAGRS